MPGVLAEIKSLFGDDRGFYDILNIKKEATKDEVKYCSDLITDNTVIVGLYSRPRSRLAVSLTTDLASYRLLVDLSRLAVSITTD